MRIRRGWVAAILVLVAVQCLFWFVAAEIAWAVRHFLTIDPQVIAERTRAAVAWFVWCGLNFAGLLAFAIRQHRLTFWLVAAIQVANLGIALWIGAQQVSDSCGQHGQEWLIPSGLAGVILVVMYGAWRRGNRLGRASTSRRLRSGILQPALFVVWTIAGLGLLGLSWQLSIEGIQLQSGVVGAVRVVPGVGLHLTLDGSSRDFSFDEINYERTPDVRVADRVGILTGDGCGGYGAALAVQSQGGIWIDSIYGEVVQPFTPNTWWLHELLRWLALTAGIIFSVSGLVALVRQIG